MSQQSPVLSDLYKRQIDYSMSVANALLDGTSRIEKLLIESTREEIGNQYEFFKSLGSAGDSNGIGMLQAEFLRDKPSDFVHLQTELMQIAQDTQQALAQSIEVLELGDDASRIDPFGPWLSALSGGSQTSGQAGSARSDSPASPLGPMQGLIDLWRNQMTATIKAFDSSVDQLQQQGQAARQAFDEAVADAVAEAPAQAAPNADSNATTPSHAHASKRGAT